MESTDTAGRQDLSRIAVLEGAFGPSGAPLRNLLKDLAIVCDLARENGIRLRAAPAARDVYERLAAAGMAAADIAAAWRFLAGEVD